MGERITWGARDRWKKQGDRGSVRMKKEGTGGGRTGKTGRQNGETEEGRE